MAKETKKRHKIYKPSQESWFYKTFIKNTVNDNFFTAAEVLDKESNQDLIAKIKRKIKINNQ